jgi:hypothetical protein
MAPTYQLGACAKSGATFCARAYRWARGHGHGVMASRSRGRFCPSLAAVRRPMEAKGRREGRAPAGTRDPCATEMHTGWTTGDAGRPAFPARMVLTVSFVLSPGSDALLPPSPCRSLMRAPVGRYITASLDAQTPGVRTTRLLRPRTVLPDYQGLARAHPGQPTSPL